MIKVMFVCHGNYCRSPMAEAVFRKMVEDAGLSGKISVDSSGTDGWNEGGSPHKKTLGVLKAREIPCENLFGEHLKPEHLDEFDYIIAMDEENLRDILSLKKSLCASEIRLLSHYATGWVSVPDSWITGDFELAYRLIEEGCFGLLRHIEKHDLLPKFNK